jgi:hypothetical protein
LIKIVNEYLLGKDHYMNYFDERHFCLSITFRLALLIGIFICEYTLASKPDMARYYEKRLQQGGYQTDTSEGIISATKSKSSFERHIALELLAERSPKEAINVLKQSLNDEAITVRRAAAHLLGTLGDKSGLEQMQKDFEEFIPKEEEPNDPNILKDSKKLEKWKATQDWYAGTALEIGKVLAEYGDFRAYELAVKEGLSDASSATKSRSAVVLGEIGKRASGRLKEDAVAVLCRMAESEKAPTVFREVWRMADEIGGGVEIQILEKAISNPHQAEKEIGITRTILWTAKKKMQTNLSPVVEPNGSPEPNRPPK